MIIAMRSCLDKRFDPQAFDKSTDESRTGYVCAV